MDGDATNQETRLSNRSASAAISFARSRIFAVISATVLRSAIILAASRVCDAPGVLDADFFAAGLAALPLPGLWRMASIRFILSAPILPGKRAQNPYGLGPRTVRGRAAGLYRGIAFADTRETLDFAGSRPLPSSTAGLYRENWTLPGRYPKSRLMAPRDGAMRAGIGGFDGFRMIPVAPSRATSASG
jgi:hypothetical protein